MACPGFQPVQKPDARCVLSNELPLPSEPQRRKNSDVTQDLISNKGRGDTRPIWELLYNHYVVLKGLDAPYISAFAKKIRPEGGGGNYGPNSGGFDRLGYGTLTYILK